MLDQPLHPALRYDPSIEEAPGDEAETLQGIMEQMRKVQETTLEHEGRALRSVHAKSHALVQGEMEVAADLPVDLAQGLFGRPGRHPVVLRFSTIPGDILDDSVSTPRGLSIKVFGVEGGERLPGSERDTTQDFVLVNGPVFGAPTPKVFLANLKLLAATTEKAEGAKKAISGVLQGVNAAVKAVSGQPNPVLAQLGGQAETHILGDTFWSQTPFRFGDYVAKVRLLPVSPELKALKDEHLKINGVPNALREACQDFFSRAGGLWDLQVQLRTDAKAMPIEDASKEWSDEDSPYRTVARIKVTPQTGWSEARSDVVDGGYSFSVWHGLAAHRPLGGVNRTRLKSYEAAAQFRGEHNHQSVSEPTQASLPA